MTSLDSPPTPETEDAPVQGIRGRFRELRRRRVPQTAAWYIGASAALLQAADVFQQGLSLPEGTVRFLAVAAVCGLPVALVFAWAYDVNADRRGTGGPWARHLLVGGMVLAALTAAALWFVRFPTSTEGPPGENPMPSNRVAILAFDAPGASAETTAFATYLQERLIEGLSAAAANVSDTSRLRVISRAGTLPYSDGSLTTDSIGRALKAGTLVTGIVEATVSRVRVRLHLIDAASAEVLSTSQVDAEPGDDIELVDAVADSLGIMVRKSLGTIVSHSSLHLETQSQEAFGQLVRSEYWKEDSDEALGLRDLDRAQRSIEEADQALARAEGLDPRWAEPAVLRGFLAYHGARLAQAQGRADLADIYDRGLEHAERAVRIAPDDPRALLIRGALRATLAAGHSIPPGEDAATLRSGAESDLNRAAATSPRPAEALRRLSELVAEQGRLEDALSYGQRAYEEDPYLQSTAQTILRMFEYSLGLDRDDDAARWCAEGDKRFSNVPFFQDCRLLLMAWSRVGTPDPDSAWEMVGRELASYPAALRPRLEPRLDALVAATLARTQHTDSARAVLGRALAQDSSSVGINLAAAGVQAWLGNPDRAMRHIRRVLERAPGERARLERAPELRTLRDFPEFRSLVDGR